MKPSIRIVGLALLFASAPGTAALELTVSPEVFQKTLERDVFRQQGRYYLAGDPGSRCTYAFLEYPRLRFEGSRVVIDAHFSGRAAVEVLGQCVGPGEAFDVRLSGMPFVNGTTLGLRDLRMDSGLDFEGLIEDFVRGELAQKVRFDLQPELFRLASEALASSGYRLGLNSLILQDVRVSAGRLALQLNLRLDIDPR